MSAMFAAMLAVEFDDQFEDLRAALPDRPGFRDRPLSGITDLAIHHTVTSKTTTWSAIQQGHFARGFSGIGYTLGIGHGKVALFGNPEQARACCKGINHLVLCIVILGDYTREALDPADHDLLRRLIHVVDAFLGRECPVKGHGQLPGQATECPGAAVLAVLPTIRGATAPSPAIGRDEAALAFHKRIRLDAPSREVVGLNPAAGLTRAILADHFVPTSAEYDAADDAGVGYVCQTAQAIKNGRVVRRVYMAKRADWSIRFLDVT